MRLHQGNFKGVEVSAASHPKPKTTYSLHEKIQVKNSIFITAKTCHLPKPRTSSPEEANERKLKKPLQTKGREKNIGFHQNVKLGSRVKIRYMQTNLAKAKSPKNTTCARQRLLPNEAKWLKLTTLKICKVHIVSHGRRFFNTHYPSSTCMATSTDAMSNNRSVGPDADTQRLQRRRYNTQLLQLKPQPIRVRR